MEYELSLANSPNDVEDVFALINKRIEWMDHKEIKHWNVFNYCELFPLQYYHDQMNKGNLYVLKQTNNKKVVGAIVLTETDVYWDDNVPAYYLHNFVADADAKGAGREILSQIEKIAINNHKERVRLDCIIDNSKLNTYYEQAGYNIVGELKDAPYEGYKREKKLY